MRRFAFCRILLLALLLAVSHVALAAHVTAHSGADLGQCALCIDHAKSGSATLQSEDFSVPFILGAGEFNPPRTRSIQRLAVRPYQTRAPPPIS